MRSRWLKATTAVAVLVVAAGCGSAKSTGGKSETVPGVTDKEITLGVLAPLTGTFGALTKPVVAGLQLYWDEKNADGGVCGRQVKLLTQDNQYNSQIAVSQYQDIKGKVLAMAAVPGTPIATAVSPLAKEGQILTMVPTQASNLLDNPYIVMPMTMYEQEVLNGISFLMKEKGLGKGDTIGVVGFVGDYGDAVMNGVKFAADKEGMKVVEQRINPTDADMSSQASAFRSAGVKHVIMATAGSQTASLASVAQSSGYDLTIMALYPAFDVGALSTTAKDALVKTTYVASSAAPFGADSPTVTKVRDAFTKAYPDVPPALSVNTGYGSSALMATLLDKACADGKTLTRESLNDAMDDLGSFDSDGVLVPLDFSDRTKSPSDQSFILKVDAGVPGGLATVSEPAASELATSFQD